MSTPHRTLTALAVIILTIIALAGTATAGTMAAAHTTFYHATTARHDKHHKHARHARRRHHSRPAQPAYKPTGIRYAAYDNEHCTAQTTIPELQAHDANVLRLVVPDNPTETYTDVPCIQAARNAGYRTYLSIQYPTSDTPQQVAAHIRTVLNAYGPQWAVAIGNEEDFSQTVPEYLRDWDAAEPVVAKMDPSAIRVLADAPPEPVQGRPEQLIKSRPIGAQAYAYHCYKADGGGLVSAGLDQVHELARFAQAFRLPVWCSEMTPGLDPTNWLVRQTTSQWATNVRQVVSQSPNLQMISYYVWPSIGAY